MRTGVGSRLLARYPCAHEWKAPPSSCAALLRSARLTSELLPADGGLYHRPADGADHNCDAVDEGGVCGDPCLQHYGRGICGKVELARLEPVQGALALED